MNLSLRNRVAACFIIANVVIMLISFIVFHFLNSLNVEITNLMDQSYQVTLKTDEIRTSIVKVLKEQRKLMIVERNNRKQVVDLLIDNCNGLISQLQGLNAIYKNQEIKDDIKTLITQVDYFKTALSKGKFIRSTEKSYDFVTGVEIVNTYADKILDTFLDFQYKQNKINKDQEHIKSITTETKKKMMITLIIGFFTTILLGLIVPGKIALPFKKINDAIRELQECNFDVSIFYNQNDEIGEIASEMNKMIHSMKKFEELRSDRISVELRKFDALANLVKKPILVANAEAKLIYINKKVYELLKVESDDVLKRDLSDTRVPESIIKAIELAIKRRSKIENAEIHVPSLESESENEEELQEEIFTGFANVIPIRGKDSSLDYYLMVMSEEVFS